MAYKPETVTTEIVSGKGEVVFSPDGTQVKVSLVRNVKNEEGVWGEVQKDYYLLREKCPEELKPGYYAMRLTSRTGKNREMVSFYPADGVFDTKFFKFPTRDDEQPSPRVNEGKFGKYETFMALLKIVKGEFAGLEVPVFCAYNFAPFEDEDGTVVAAYSKSFSKSEPTQFLNAFLEAVGAWDNGPIPYKDNILPMVQKRAKAADKMFKIVLASGKVVEFRTTSQETETESWGGFEETASPAPEFSESDGEPPWPVEAETSDEKEIDLESDDAWAE